MGLGLDFCRPLLASSAAIMAMLLTLLPSPEPRRPDQTAGDDGLANFYPGPPSML